MGLRDKNTKIVQNSSGHYKKILERRGVKNLSHYGTPTLRHPTISERASIATTGHIWAYGDRFYKLAHKYYGDANFWWVIAWRNGQPTEATIQTGDFLDIPLDINKALDALGV